MCDMIHPANLFTWTVFPTWIPWCAPVPNTCPHVVQYFIILFSLRVQFTRPAEELCTLYLILYSMMICSNQLFVDVGWLRRFPRHLFNILFARLEVSELLWKLINIPFVKKIFFKCLDYFNLFVCSICVAYLMTVKTWFNYYPKPCHSL